MEDSNQISQRRMVGYCQRAVHDTTVHDTTVHDITSCGVCSAILEQLPQYFITGDRKNSSHYDPWYYYWVSLIFTINLLPLVGVRRSPSTPGICAPGSLQTSAFDWGLPATGDLVVLQERLRGSSDTLHEGLNTFCQRLNILYRGWGTGRLLRTEHLSRLRNWTPFKTWTSIKVKGTEHLSKPEHFMVRELNAFY